MRACIGRIKHTCRGAAAAIRTASIHKLRSLPQQLCLKPLGQSWPNQCRLGQAHTCQGAAAASRLASVPRASSPPLQPPLGPPLAPADSCSVNTKGAEVATDSRPIIVSCHASCFQTSAPIWPRRQVQLQLSLMLSGCHSWLVTAGQPSAAPAVCDGRHLEPLHWVQSLAGRAQAAPEALQYSNSSVTAASFTCMPTGTTALVGCEQRACKMHVTPGLQRACSPAPGQAVLGSFVGGARCRLHLQMLHHTAR